MKMPLEGRERLGGTRDMRNRTTINIGAVCVVLMTAACNQPEPPPATATTVSRESAAAAELERKRRDEMAQMDSRVADLERRWTEMESKLTAKTRTATATLRDEVKEDVSNVRRATADLRTTAPENWWERHERAMERAAEDIEADVRRLTRGKAAASVAAVETTVQTPFESRRDQFVKRHQARVELMNKQLKNVRARGAQETELEDTRARVEKLKDDLNRLERASVDDWWEISAKRVNEYIDRVESSIRRLDDNK